MKNILLFVFLLIFACSSTAKYLASKSYVEDPAPSPPVYPPRWTAQATFNFTNMTTKSNAGAGVAYQIIDSPNQKFRTDDLYYAGTFPVPYDTLFSSSSSSNKYQYYASLTSNGVSCVTYPGIPTTLSQNWVAEMCKYNLTLYYDTTKAHRWNCATDIVTWFIDLAAEDGRLIYQHTLPQPFFDIYQDLWFTNYTIIEEEFDLSIFIPPKGWNCSNNTIS